MAGIIGIYGLVVSVLISDGLKPKQPLFTSFIQLGAGLSVGLSGLAAGFAIGIVGDAGVRGTAQQPRLFVGMILILIFAEVLGKCRSVLFVETHLFIPRLSERKTLISMKRSLWSDCRPLDERQGRLFDRMRLVFIRRAWVNTWTAALKRLVEEVPLGGEEKDGASTNVLGLPWNGSVLACMDLKITSASEYAGPGI